MRTSHPATYGSSFTVSGASTTAWFTSSTSPESGAITSETALTDSTSPYDESFATCEPCVGASKCTSSPSASWANQVTPSTASSPSMRAQSCSRWYLRVSGYDSAAANSVLPLCVRPLYIRRPVDRFLHDLGSARLPPHVDRQGRLGCGLRGRDVPHADADVEHRRMGARGHLAPALDRHALARDRLLLHHERHELRRGPLLLDAAQLFGAAELLAERTGPAETRGDRVGLRRDVVAVQREARLETQRRAPAEAARRHAAREHR